MYDAFTPLSSPYNAYDTFIDGVVNSYDGHLDYGTGNLYGGGYTPVGNLDDYGNMYNTWGINTGWVDAYGDIRDPYYGNTIGSMNPYGGIKDFSGSLINPPY